MSPSGGSNAFSSGLKDCFEDSGDDEFVMTCKENPPALERKGLPSIKISFGTPLPQPNIEITVENLSKPKIQATHSSHFDIELQAMIQQF